MLAQRIRSSTPRTGAASWRRLGAGNPTGFHGPWRKAFTNFVLRRAGKHPGPSLRAIDALRDGAGIGASGRAISPSCAIA